MSYYQNGVSGGFLGGFQGFFWPCELNPKCLPPLTLVYVKDTVEAQQHFAHTPPPSEDCVKTTLARIGIYALLIYFQIYIELVFYTYKDWKCLLLSNKIQHAVADEVSWHQLALGTFQVFKSKLSVGPSVGISLLGLGES